MAITAPQCRAARAFLSWSRQELSQAARVAERTIIDFERGARNPYERTLRDIEEAFQSAGIEFIEEDGRGVGVRFRSVSGG